MIYSTYLGGSGGDEGGSSITIDSEGNAYVTGITKSSNFPIIQGAYDTTFDGIYPDAFVSKLNLTGSGLIYSTYLGGNEESDAGWSIALDSEGNAYVTGSTKSFNFPVTPGAYQVLWWRSLLGGCLCDKIKFNRNWIDLFYISWRK